MFMYYVTISIPGECACFPSVQKIVETLLINTNELSQAHGIACLAAFNNPEIKDAITAGTLLPIDVKISILKADFTNSL